jgi:hypothetical protein
MDADGQADPLTRLAAELEKLSEAQLQLTEATEQLFLAAREARPALNDAISDSRDAARVTAHVSAKVQDAADERRDRFRRS